MGRMKRNCRTGAAFSNHPPHYLILVIIKSLAYYPSDMRSKIVSIFAVLLLLVSFQDSYSEEDKFITFRRRPASEKVGFYQESAVHKLLEGKSASPDSVMLLALRVAFEDLDFWPGSEDSPPHDSVYFHNELRHLQEYYSGASNGRFRLNFELYGEVVKLSRPQAYYGKDEANWDWKVLEMLIEAVEASDSSIDFSKFESFALIHAGPGEETDIIGDSPEQIWSGFLDPGEIEEALADTLATPGVATGDSTAEGVFYIDNLLVLPEDSSQDDYAFGSLGIYAYQFGKRMGMLPLYDSTPSGFPDSQGIGNFGLMSYGLYNVLGYVPAFPSAFNRYLMGWVDAVKTEGEALVRLRDINAQGYADTQMVRIDISPLEYFLVVNRVHDSNFNGFFDFGDLEDDGIPHNPDTLLGAEFDFYMTQDTNPYTVVEKDGRLVRKYKTGSGLMVWHVDERVIMNSIISGGNPNDRAEIKGVDLEEADGVQDLDGGGGRFAFGSYFDSFREGGKKEFGPNTLPSSSANAGFPSGVVLSEISASGPIMSFRLSLEAFPNRVEAELAGDVTGISPVPFNGQTGGVDILLAADTGLVYAVRGTESEIWAGSVELIGEFPQESWVGPPALGDVDGDLVHEIFLISDSFSLCALDAEGAFHPVDSDETPGILALEDSMVSLPVMIETDSDTMPELLFLSNSSDSVYINIAYSSGGFRYGRVIGNGIWRWAQVEGKLFSNPAAALVADGQGQLKDGFFFAANGPEGSAYLHFIGGFSSGAFSMTRSRRLPFYVPDGLILQPSAGDVDGDGSDEMVIPVPGEGMVFWSPSTGRISVYASAEDISPPSLEDVDGDGVLDTAFRGRKYLYQLTGMGVLAYGWPVRLDPVVMKLEESIESYAQPLISDVDGDGECEILFNIAGDIHAYEFGGRACQDWIVPGPGFGVETPAVFPGHQGELTLITVGSGSIVEAGYDYETGPEPGSIVSIHNTGRPFLAERGWFSYRHDPGGSGRQEKSIQTSAVEGIIDENSFICYPNPVYEEVMNVRISIFGPASVKITILNIEGERVLESNAEHIYSDGSMVPYDEAVDLSGLAGGVYICRLDVKSSGKRWTGARKFAVVN